MAANTICWQKLENVILEIKTMLLSRPPPASVSSSLSPPLYCALCHVFAQSTESSSQDSPLVCV